MTYTIAVCIVTMYYGGLKAAIIHCGGLKAAIIHCG
jgi:hypothetical protein